MRLISLYTLLNRRHARYPSFHRQNPRHRSAWTVEQIFARIGAGVLACLFALLAAGILWGAFAYADLTADLPSLEGVLAYFHPQSGPYLEPTRFYDRTGSQVLLSLENPGIPRRYLTASPLAEEHLSPELLQATVGLEQADFWQSSGVDWQHWMDPQPQTLAERLVNRLLVDQEPAGLRRSLRMRLLAGQLVEQYGAQQVLEWYLNSTYYGHLAYGADSASWLYLNKPASQLNLAEAVLLASVSQAPALNPLDAPVAARDRQQEALARLLLVGTIDVDTFQKTRSLEIKLSPAAPEKALPAAAFTRLAESQMVERFGRERLERGGLQIITSLDLDVQKQMSCTAQVQLKRLSGQGQESVPGCQADRLLPTLPPSEPLVGLAASGLLLDVPSGQVLALLGETTLEGETSLLNGHPPGSLLSPFVALASFVRGDSPATLLWDIPPVQTSTEVVRKNPDGVYHGPVRLRTALANDYLAPLSQLLGRIGPNNAWKLAETLGLRSLADHPEEMDLLYAGGKTTLLEMAQAYAVLADQGVAAGARTPAGLSPVLVLEVRDLQGKVWLDQRQPETQPLLSAPLAYLAQHILSDEGARWPSLGYPNPLEIGRPAGAKLGRTAAGKDAWAIGYTPRHLAAFWLGIPADTAEAVKLNPRLTAGIWHAMMQYVSQPLAVESWPVPAGLSMIDVCDPSGMLPTGVCPNVVNEVFLNGNEPTGADTLYRVYQINRETGRLATVFTPPALVQERTYLVVPPEAQAWARSTNVPLPPETYDTLQPPSPSATVQFSSPALFAFVHGKVSLRGTAAGDGFSFYRLQVGQGLNPQTWLQVGSDQNTPVTSGELGVWDTQGKEGLFAVRLMVVRADQRIESTTIQVTVDNTSPRIRIEAPLAGQRFSLATERVLSLNAEAADAVGLAKVSWWIDGAQVGERVQPPYRLYWEAKPGEHRLSMRAVDLAGNEQESETVTFYVEK